MIIVWILHYIPLLRLKTQSQYNSRFLSSAVTGNQSQHALRGKWVGKVYISGMLLFIFCPFGECATT